MYFGGREGLGLLLEREPLELPRDEDRAQGAAQHLRHRQQALVPQLHLAWVNQAHAQRLSEETYKRSVARCVRHFVSLTEAVVGEAQQPELGLGRVEAQDLLVAQHGLVHAAPEAEHHGAVRDGLHVLLVQLCTHAHQATIISTPASTPPHVKVLQACVWWPRPKRTLMALPKQYWAFWW
jgi:hypothetical protein